MAFNASAAATELRAAMKGLGTDEGKLVDVVSKIPLKSIVAVNDAYKKEIKRNLLEDIKDECGGELEHALVAMLTPPPQYDAHLLRNAMKGIGTNEGILFEVLCTRSSAEIKEINKEYLNIFSHDLEEDVRGEVSGDLKKLLVARIKSNDDAKHDLHDDVEKLHHAAKGAGTDETVFIHILANRPKEYLDKLNTEYANKHGKSLAALISAEMRGDLGKSLTAMVSNIGDYFAKQLHEAMKGAGTDDKTLIRIIASQRGRHLKEICASYLRFYDKSLRSAVDSECSGKYGRLLERVIKEHGEK